MSDDIPIIFAEELRRTGVQTPTAVFLSASGTPQMQQYATAGWSVSAIPGFRTAAPVTLGDVPATSIASDAIPACTLVSSEAKYLPAETAGLIKRWQPAFVKFNCAFYEIADATGLAAAVTGLGYTVFAGIWRDDNSFGYRSLSAFGPLAGFPTIDWARTNIVGVKDAVMAHTLQSVARLYVGEERRIADLRVANAIRNDHITRLEDALLAHQKP